MLIDDKQQRDLPTTEDSEEHTVPHVKIAILGTGFAGLGMAIRLKQSGYHDFVVLERSTEIGGTWRDNTYPGCACDVPSHLYSFSFALKPDWSRMYSPQSEIQAYLRQCAEKYDILPHIRWNDALLDASWREDEHYWHLTTAQGQLKADLFILGNGPLNQPSFPNIPGLERFEGTLFHSAQWRHDYDLHGKRVAVIGTGASAIQFLPRIQPLVSHLTLFQRTPPWIVPRLDHPIAAWQQRLYRLLPLAQRAVRTQIYWQREIAVLGMLRYRQVLEQGVKIARKHLEAQVPDPVLRAKLTPNYTMGCKRVLLSDDFYPALTKSNVDLVTEHIREVRAHSIVTQDGQEHEVDTIICGTGFHVTDRAFPNLIHGRAGRSLGEIWEQDGISAYYGTTVTGFPNLCLLIGPNTGLGHNSMIFMIESQINYIMDALRIMGKRKIQTFEVRPEVEQAFNETLQRDMQGTVWTSGCKSWYLDAKGRNRTIWPGFTFDFRRKTRHFDPQNYMLTPQKSGTHAEHVLQA